MRCGIRPVALSTRPTPVAPLQQATCSPATAGETAGEAAPLQQAGGQQVEGKAEGSSECYSLLPSSNQCYKPVFVSYLSKVGR